MKFNEMTYTRPDFEKSKKNYEELFKNFKDQTLEEQITTINEWNKLSDDFATNATLCSVRHSIDTRDEFYEKENEYFDEVGPLFSNLAVEANKTILSSKHLEGLKKHFGPHYFEILECSLVMKEEAIPFMQKENALVSKYNKLIASAKIDFDGKTNTLAQMGPYTQVADRKTRKEAHEAITKFFEENEAEFDKIYDDLVKVRNEMALALGYKNYVDLQYKFLYRTDYNSEDVKRYREYIYKNFTPLAVKLREKQAERIGLKDDFKYYDWGFSFKEGNPNPIGDPEFIVNQAIKMYHELSKETGEFIDVMTGMELMDLVAKPGKQAGGYCTDIPNYKVPFIFSNFNGTQGDVEVVTHEAGHAFQVYSSRNMIVPEYRWPTYEACEIHSMSMEFLTWPWMELFFGEAVNRFKNSHLSGAIEFLPYGVTIDEFQHFVYENPEATPEERKKKYHEIEMKYRPNVDYADNEFLKKGTYWFRQGHVFNTPFYYIDYTLAQVCAFQFLIKSLENRDKAFDEYLTLCKAGGSESFFGLMKIGKLENPMVEGTLEKIIPKLEEILDSIKF
ncbi:M3 family oligoendopeptidase [Peptoniphilus duerdenii]|uniref:M3 family oligoendopeptidase n=1 Tax=Peptoniphilus duerdenii TaxID=507750 RepID=UPI00288B3EF9|nr:M3 family oligoendopeptidase [Peptoniphilus duerdenii]